MYFIVEDVCSAFLSDALYPAFQYVFTLTWKNQQYTLTVMRQGLPEAPLYLSQVLNDDLQALQFLCSFTLIQYSGELLFYSPDITSSQEGSLYLLEMLAIKEHM